MTSRKAAAGAEPGDEYAISSFANLSFAAYNIKQDRSIAVLIIQYPYLVLEDNALDPGDEIEVRALDNLGRMVADPILVTLDENLSGEGQIRFVDNGYFTVSDNGLLMVFDAGGIFVVSQPFSGGLNSQPLPAGSYTAVFIEKTGLLSKVLTIGKLDELGLVNGMDYKSKQFRIDIGAITELGEIAVPPLDSMKFSYTEEQSFMSNKQTLALCAGFASLRLEYALRDGLATSNEILRIELQPGLKLLGGSVTLHGRTAPYTYEDGVLNVMINQQSDLLRFCVEPNRVGEWFASAFLSFSIDGGCVIQPMGQVTVEAMPMKINAPKKTSGSSQLPAMRVPTSRAEIHPCGHHYASLWKNW